MFWLQMLATFRLYNENLSISYTCICSGCTWWVGGKCEISQVLGYLDLEFALVRNYIKTKNYAYL
jgi:hypothetical protein